MDAFTTKEVAEKYKISTRRVRAIAKNRDLGEKCGHDLFFSEEDVVKMEPGSPGRPPRAKTDHSRSKL